MPVKPTQSIGGWRSMLWLIIALGLGRSTMVFGQSEQPNILLVVADDLGLQLGCYGDPAARTPQMDELAREGLRFEVAYVTQSSCSSSRSSILTGLYPHQNGQIGLANRGYAMHPGVPTLPTLLQAVGYRTGIIGKLHVNPEEDFPFDYADKNMKATREVRSVADKAAGFWAGVDGHPWFLMVNYFDPHVPFRDQIEGQPSTPQAGDDVNPFSFQRIDTATQRTHIAGYYNGVARVDAGLGMLLARLAETGTAENTIVVFLGDNGPPFVRAKTNCTEAGLRMPLIVRWPGVTSPGDVSPALVSAVDLVPTFLRAAGVAPVPELPGRDLRPVLAGGPAAALRTYLAAEYNAHRADMYFPQRAIRDQRYKLVLNLHDERPAGIEVDGDPAATVLDDPVWADTVAQRALQLLAQPLREELYDLQNDPDELLNLAGDPVAAATLNHLRQALQSWRFATGDPTLPQLAATSGGPTQPQISPEP